MLGKHYWEHIKGFFVEVEAQSGEPDPLPVLVATLVSLVHLPASGAKMVPELVKRVSYVPKAAQGFESVFKAGVGLIEGIYNTLRKLVGKQPVDFCDAITAQIRKWCREAEVLELELVRCKADNPSVEFIEKLFSKIQDGYHLKHCVSDEKHKVVLGRAIDRLEARLRPYETQLQAAKTFRVEPEFLLLYGASKQGKTTMLVRAAVTVLLLAGLVEPAHVLTNLWQKGDTKYFESYCGQKCLIMDDVFQEKVIAGMEGNEFMQIIRMIGNWSYPLNMASVDLKAKFYFTSPVVIGTTNLPSIGATTAPQVISCAEAVSRRVHRCLKIEAADDYALEGGLDYVKMDSELQDRTCELYEQFLQDPDSITVDAVLNTFPWHAWKATKWDWNEGTSTGQEVDLRTYFQEMADKVRSKIDAHNRSIQNLKKFTDMLAAVKAKVPVSSTEVEPQSGSSVDRNLLARAVESRRLDTLPNSVQEMTPEEYAFWRNYSPTDLIDEIEVAEAQDDSVSITGGSPVVDPAENTDLTNGPVVTIRASPYAAPWSGSTRDRKNVNYIPKRKLKPIDKVPPEVAAIMAEHLPLRTLVLYSLCYRG